MSAPPYMKLYVADYLGDTHHLGALEHGAYLLLLMAMWRAGGSLPAADGNLARMARCTPAQWAEIRDSILPFFKRSRGRLTHKRLGAELAKYEDISGKRAEASRKAVAEKRKKNSGSALPIGTQDADHLVAYPEPEPEPESIGGVGSASARPEPAADWPASDLVRHLVEAAASPWLDPNKSPGLITTAGRIAAWQREGASWAHDVLPVVTGICASRRQPVGTWKFFDAAIARSIADNRQALEMPEATRHDRPRSVSPQHDKLADVAAAMGAAFGQPAGDGGGSGDHLRRQPAA